MLYVGRWHFRHEDCASEPRIIGLGHSEVSPWAFLGDEVRIALEKTTSKGFDLYLRATRTDAANHVALAKIGILFYNYRTRRVVDVPDRFLAL